MPFEAISFLSYEQDKGKDKCKDVNEGIAILLVNIYVEQIQQKICRIVKRHLVFKNEAQIFNVTNQGIIVTQKY
jgi:hypothetical protein